MDGISVLSDGADAMESWIDQELTGCEFADARLGKRFGTLMEQMSTGIGRTIPLACGDWAATKAAYRFLDNDRVSEAEILAGHFQATRDRFAATEGPVLVLHDTTEFSFTRENTQAIGLTHKVAKGHKDKRGRQRMHTVCGILMHSSLAVTTDGLPLGLTAIKLWTRKKFKGTNALQGKTLDGGKHSINMTRIPIEEKERASGGWRTRGRRPRSWRTPPASFTSGIAKATSMNFFVSANPWRPSSSSAPAMIAVWRMTVERFMK